MKVVFGFSKIEILEGEKKKTGRKKVNKNDWKFSNVQEAVTKGEHTSQMNETIILNSID